MTCYQCYAKAPEYDRTVISQYAITLRILMLEYNAEQSYDGEYDNKIPCSGAYWTTGRCNEPYYFSPGIPTNLINVEER